MSVFLPNPCLLGIVLVITTHTGPQLVFHYPPTPKVYNYQATPFALDNDLIDSADEISDESDYLSDELSDEDSLSANSQRNFETQEISKSSNYVSGQTLLDLLDEQDRRRKEKEKRKRRSNITKKNSTSSGSFRNNSIDSSSLDINNLAKESGQVFGFDPEFLSEIVTPPRQLCNTRFEFTVDDTVFLGLPIHINEEGLWRTKKQKREAKSKHSTNASVNESSKSHDLVYTNEDGYNSEDKNSLNSGHEETNENTMTMFHVVFVMNPPVVEFEYRADEMFHYVASRLSLVLRYEQAKSNFVSNECHNILKIKETNENLPIYQLYNIITEKSPLASALAKCFNSISTSQIANLQINDKLISLQIPLKNSFRNLMPKTTPVLPGSFLSSMNIVGEDEEDIDNEFSLENMGYMALLLLDSPEKIISDLKADSTSPLTTFIQNIHPMISLNRLAALSEMDLSQVISFSRHLIYWRRARSIIPLHSKSVFIVSPMAPMEQIPQNMKIFKADFPSLPSLPLFLALLSNSKPRPYAAIIPSKDHRDIYLDALAWLMRYGYVTQLLTFVWLKVSNGIKLEVEEEMERDGIATKRDKAKFADISVDNTTRAKKEDTEKLKSYLNGKEVKIEEEEEEDIILLDPERATALERRWINRILRVQTPELIQLFQKVVRYFNGKTPIELIISKENISRTELKKILHAISEHIVSVKHW
ncbi:hypothetical protein WICMUC_004024 [Wickerhamomyces mucosus]|uniref:Nitrogen permease regulator 3 n=1 Tax=Wickerhamomyces mucosus TaxID=1378264 RepID=A0A9P8PJ64_9ASCO|nr:hypothetical protein WICMUC_004024 [Wickerhamomyces mucosus]